ncbi:MAG: TetR/AcrR family transcriptional regulator [Chloroflexi bacterium]|nr:MAG: TetR/AcrR family transcriptional regulator [Chloroflexota bacterium]
MSRSQRTGRLGRPPKLGARQTRDAILDTALELFAAQGFAGTSLRQIAHAIGISESAIYAHFESKQAIYETLFEQVGPPTAFVLDFLQTSGDAMGEADPAVILRQFTQHLLIVWDEPCARRFASFFMREGVLATESGRGSVQAAIRQAQQEFGQIFRHWMERGRIQEHVSPEHLVWELLAPLVTIRFLYLHADATEAQRHEGHRLAEQHIDYFLLSVRPT